MVEMCFSLPKENTADKERKLEFGWDSNTANTCAFSITDGAFSFFLTNLSYASASLRKAPWLS